MQREDQHAGRAHHHQRADQLTQQSDQAFGAEQIGGGADPVPEAERHRDRGDHRQRHDDRQRAAQARVGGMDLRGHGPFLAVGGGRARA
ncbi:MAG: hypothetical protein NVV68_03215 [Dokdonella sp.]|nr:hypothetical protein [Dokdonella sp.]